MKKKILSEQQDQFDQWVDLWEKAQKSPDFFKKEEEQKQEMPLDYFGNWNQSNNNPNPVADPDAKYWDDLHRLGDDPALFTEQEIKKSKKHPPEEATDPVEKPPIKEKAGKYDPQGDYPDSAEFSKNTLNPTKYDGDTAGDVAKHFAKQMNPLQTATKGKDALPRKVTPNFTAGKELVELANMKKSLNDLESKVGSSRALANPSKARKIQKEIDALWEKLDALSDKLSPDFLTDYLS